MIVWTTSLEDGRPLRDVEIEVPEASRRGATGDDGVVVLSGKFTSPLVTARRGNDVALLVDDFGASAQSLRPESRSYYAWYVFDDRDLYRPGEQVKMKGWIRHVGAGPTGDVGPLPASLRTVAYVAQDARGNPIAKGEVSLDAFGGFFLELSLPRDVSLGDARVVLKLPDGGTRWHVFQVQEFRRPDFEVEAQASDGPHGAGARAEVTASASYFTGGALSDSAVTWSVTHEERTYTPPNRGDFTFGAWTKPWRRETMRGTKSATPRTFEARTDAAGRHVLRLDFGTSEPPRPVNVEVQATVRDMNRQVSSASTTLLVHPADLYVGLKSERHFVQRGDTLRIDAIVTDLDGALVAERPLSVRAERRVRKQVAGEWREVTADTQLCELRSAREPVRCEIEAREGGIWRVTAVVVDDRQRRNQSELLLWVADAPTPSLGSASRRGASRGRASRGSRQQDALELVPDHAEYRPGQTAEILVIAPFAPAEGLMTLARSGLIRHERFRMTGRSHTLRVPIEAGWTPNVHVSVHLVGAAPRLGDDGEPGVELPVRPAFATASLDLSIPPVERTLALRVTPRSSQLEPRGKTTLDVELRDAAGKPVSEGDVAVVVVDEAVLALTGHRFPDPIQSLYFRSYPDLMTQHSRDQVPGVGLDPFDTLIGFFGWRLHDASMDAVFVTTSSREVLTRIVVRDDFAPLALFATRVRTDAQGHAEVPVTLPDNLTRYRVMAVAFTAANQAGKGEATLTARLPLMVRPAPPRFINVGDRFELPVVVQNQTDTELSVDVAVRAQNADVPSTGRRVSVPARDRVEVRFPAAPRGCCALPGGRNGWRSRRRRVDLGARVDSGHDRGVRDVRTHRSRRDRAARRSTARCRA